MKTQFILSLDKKKILKTKSNQKETNVVFFLFISVYFTLLEHLPYCSCL